MSHKLRLQNLERKLGWTVHECPNPVTGLIVSNEEAADENRLEARSKEAGRCPNCGQMHVLVIEEVVVSANERHASAS